MLHHPPSSLTAQAGTAMASEATPLWLRIFALVFWVDME